MEPMLSSLVDALPGLVWTARPDGVAEYFNQRWCEYTGLQADDVSGQGWRAAVHAEDLPGLIEAWRSVIATNTPHELQVRFRHVKSGYRWFLVRMSPMAGAVGQVVNWCAINTELDNEARASDAAHWWLSPATRESYFRSIMDSIPVHASLMTPAGELEFVNNEILEYYGVSLEELRRSGFDVIHPDDRAPVLAALQKGNGSSVDYEARVRRADGVYRWFRDIGFPLRDARGRIVTWYFMSLDIDDQKRAEEALQRSEAFLADAQHLSRIGSFLWTAATEELIWSAELYRIAGVDPATPPHRDLFSARVHPDDVHILREMEEDSLTEDFGGREYEYRLVMSDKSIKYVAINSRKIYRKDGELQFLGAVQDVTERRAASEKLRRSEILLAEAQRLSRIGSFFWDATVDNLVWSEELYRIFELDPSLPPTLELFATRVHPEDAAPLFEMIGRAQAGEPVYDGLEYEYRLLLPDGSLKHVVLHSYKFLGESGEAQYFGTIQDITARRRSEEALRRSEAFLTEAQRLSRTGSFWWHGVTGELVWSDEMYRIFEIDPAAPASLDLFGSRVHPDDSSIMYAMIERAARGQPEYDGREYGFRLRMPDQSIKYVIINAHRIPGGDGQPQYVGALQDVTARRAAEEALVNARAELAHVSRLTSLGALTASITHEVSQPLSGIITNASTCQRMLAADPPNLAGARETVQRIIRDGNRASDVIKRLRALFSKKEVVSESVDLNETVRDVIALSSRELERSRVTLQQEFADDLPSVEGDRVQLQQVILNLLLNAADAMSAVYDRPRRLTVKTDRDENNQVRVSMQDTGVGFEPQTAGKMFEAFYTTKSSGMGIGLSVSRSIIQSHNGRLWAAANEGPGATFSFSIPCKPEGAADVRRAIAS